MANKSKGSRTKDLNQDLETILNMQIKKDDTSNHDDEILSMKIVRRSVMMEKEQMKQPTDK